MLSDSAASICPTARPECAGHAEHQAEEIRDDRDLHRVDGATQQVPAPAHPVLRTARSSLARGVFLALAVCPPDGGWRGKNVGRKFA